MQTYPVHIDPKQVVRWLVAEHEVAPYLQLLAEEEAKLENPTKLPKEGRRHG